MPWNHDPEQTKSSTTPNGIRRWALTLYASSAEA
jgi:hypothetical protein